jgi:hypothetical protein
MLTAAPPVQDTVASVVPGKRTDYDDGIRQRDPQTGELLATELDMVDFTSIGQGDPLRALYQGLVWAAETFQRLAKTTPAIAAMGPETEKVLDQVAYWGYQVTNTGAEVCRGLWSWPFTRVIINQQFDQIFHPEEKAVFDRLYRGWYDDVVAPVEAGTAQYDPEKVKAWVARHSDEIAKPGEFVKLCSDRYMSEKIAAKHAWSPTDVLTMARPVGERRTTTTGMESIFRKKPG